ncbi:unnamed protein product [Rotaria sp. Silwood2]|nr:unnamed protein product [Rotaria sp. Silwood2]
MAAPPQQQTTPSDHHYFEWATTKQQKLVEQSLKVVPIAVNQQQISANNTNTNSTTNMVHNHPHLHNHPLMAHTHRRHYYQHFEEKRSLEDSKQKQNKTTPGIVPSTMTNSQSLSPSSTNCNSSGHVRKKQKTNTNGIGSTSSTSSLNTSDDHTQSQQSQTCYPFQAELTQKIDIECGGGGGNGSGQKAHTPTHHFTLSTVINVSVNGQTSQQQKPLDILSSPSSSSLSQQQCPLTSNDQQDFLVHPSSSSSPSVLSTSSPSTASPSTTINSTNLNNNNNTNTISNLITSTSPSTNILSQSPTILPSSSSTSSSSSSISLIPFSELNFSSYIKDLDLTTLDSFILPICPNPQDYLTIDGLITFLNTLNTAFLVSDNNNNNNLSIQKTIEYNKRYQQQMITRSDSLTLRQTPYLPNTTQQYSDTYRIQQQQMYNYSTRPTHFEQPNRYYPNRYPSMMAPYSSYPSYSYPSHNQQYQMSQHYNYASSTNSSVNVSSAPQQNPSSMIMTGTCASSSSTIPSMNPTQNSLPSSSNYGSSSSSYDPLSSHVTHSPSNTTIGTGNVYPPSYYRQSSVASYPTSLSQQQQQQQQQQLTRQISSNFPMTSIVPSNPTTSNINSLSSSSSPAPPFR